MPPQRKPVQLNGILRRTIQLRAYDFNSHGVEIVEHLDESLPQVVGDSHQLQQVFLNIMNNAYDAVRETGRPARIEIMTASLGNACRGFFPRQRPRHHPSRSHLRSVLHHQRSGEGNRPGPEHLLRHRARARRRNPVPQQFWNPKARPSSFACPAFPSRPPKVWPREFYNDESACHEA